MKTLEEVREHLESVCYNDEVDRYGIIGFLVGKGIISNNLDGVTFTGPKENTFGDFCKWFNSQDTIKEEKVDDMEYISEKLIEIFVDSLESPTFKFHECPKTNIKWEEKNDTSRIELLYEVGEKLEEIESFIKYFPKINTVESHCLLKKIKDELKKLIDAQIIS